MLMLISHNLKQIEEMMRWADKDGDGLVSKNKTKVQLLRFNIVICLKSIHIFSET